MMFTATVNVRYDEHLPVCPLRSLTTRKEVDWVQTVAIEDLCNVCWAIKLL